jgi:protein disulfide-isomerase A1
MTYVFVLAALLHCVAGGYPGRSLSHIATAAVISTTPAVVQLTAATFNATTLESRLALVAFVAPWCGHCKKFEPEFDKAAEELKIEKGVTMARVDTVAETELYWRYEVEGFPTVKLFRYGVEADLYEGTREADGVVEYMRQKMRDREDLEEIKTAEDFKQLSAEVGTGPLVIGMYDNLIGAAAKSLLAASISPKMKKIRFVATTSAEVAAAAGMPAGSSKVVLLKGYDEKMNDLPEEDVLLPEEIVSFAQTYAWPLVLKFSQDKEEKKMMFDRRPGFDRHFICFVDSTQPHFEVAQAALKTVAEQYRTDALFIYLDTNDQANSPVIEELNVSEALPALRLVVSDAKHGKLEKFAPPDATVKNLHAEGGDVAAAMEEFLTEWASGALTAMA